MLFRIRGLIAPMLIALFSAVHASAVVTLTEDHELKAEDRTLENQDLVIRNATLTISGVHTFGSLQLLDGAVLTHPEAGQGEPDHAVRLTVTGDMLIDSASRIDASARGYASATAPGAGVAGNPFGGGGGHGGEGGMGRGTPGGPGFGSITHPDECGGPGGSSGTSAVSAGGGIVRLMVGGTLRVNGAILAEGRPALLNNQGGGAGGSVSLTVGTLTGNGRISVNGGNGEWIDGGGGGGGRIAIYPSVNTFVGTLTAFGGTGYERGGAGTLFVKAIADNPGQITVDNGDLAGAHTPIAWSEPLGLVIGGRAQVYPPVPLTIQHLEVRTNGVLTHPTGMPRCEVTVLGDAIVRPGGSISVDGRGYPSAGEVGRGVGVLKDWAGSGGGHGGEGGKSTTGAVGGAAYGSITEPTTFGSQGGPAAGVVGTAGGGAIRLVIQGRLTVDGRISADGAATPPPNNAGGGSGGSVWLTVGSLAGTGTIEANGASGEWIDGGGGGGGRIAIYSSENVFSGAVTAFGGGGHERGGAGTIFMKAATDAVGQMLVHNGDVFGAHTPVDWPTPLRLVIGGLAQVYPPTGITLQSLDIVTNGILTHPTGLSRCEVVVLGDATIHPGGRLSVEGRGYPVEGESGPGAGILLDWAGSGGGHGGEGGESTTGTRGGTHYGSITEPTTLGSQGGPAAGVVGTAGGGAIRLLVQGRLTVDGRISASGSPLPPLNNAGGGSGGSVWLTVGSLAGTGTIEANGASGEWIDGGGGGGGRIAIYSSENAFSGAVTAFGGGGHERGGAGTIFMKAATDAVGQIVVDNGDVLGAHTPITWPTPLRLVIGGLAQIYPPTGISLQSLDILTNGILTHPTGLSRCEVIVLGDATIHPGGRLSVEGRGYPVEGESGPGAGILLDWAGSGGGHGGEGGESTTGTRGGAHYGSITEPTTLGSQGGPAAGVVGTAGGGAIRLLVQGRLTVDGRISASGSPLPPLNNAGGGSGGSVWLTVGSLAGTGTIEANGASGEWIDGGGGGGGRIAIYSSENAFSGAVTAFGGGGHERGGAGTIFMKAATDAVGQMLVHNGDVLGAHTPLIWPTPLRLVIGGLAQVYPPTGISLQSLDIVTNGILTHPTGLSRCEVIVLGDATIHPGGRLAVDGRGYPLGADPGPGAGRLLDWAGSGAGHAGAGGRSTTGTPGGPSYGSALEPSTLGSQGGPGNGGPGGAGGGAVRLIVGGTLTVDGNVSADGVRALANNAGGGSGGSILLGARTLAGSGSITARGGNGEFAEGGGGSGGRIAIHRGATAFTGTITAPGGGGADRGADGSLNEDASPKVAWLGPSAGWVFGSVPLEVAIFSGPAGPFTVAFSVLQAGQETPIATVTTPLVASVVWDSTQVADGLRELRALVHDASGRVVGDARRPVQINNSVQWEGGLLAASVSWGPDRIHVVGKDLVLPRGVQLTLAPGTIVKFLPGLRLVVENGGFLAAEGTTDAPVILTSLSDDEAGGDTNLDGSGSRPVAGSWRLVERADATVLANADTRMRYHSRAYGGSLGGDETWTSQTLREITETVVVPSGATLRIEAGAILKFAPNQGIDVRRGATLEAAGSSALPVVFTSLADDAYGGDTNGDGTRSGPSAGDWRSLRFEDGSTGNMDHVVIRFGGNSVGNPWGAGGAIEALGGPLTVRNSLLSDALKDGAFCYGSTLFENCLILRCDRGLTAVGEMQVIHCTVDACRIGLLEHAGHLIARNSIVSRSLDSGIEHDLGGNIAVVTSCNVWNPDARLGNYRGLTDRTGEAGNLSAKPLYKDPETDDFRLNYTSPGIDAADGAFAPATDFAGAPRYDDPRTGNSGTPADNGAVPDVGAFEFVETAPSNIDLVVTSVLGPARIASGGSVRVEWVVVNRGSEPFRGPWHDAVYLQSVAGGERLFVAEPLVGRGLVVGPGESERVSADVRVPGGLADTYQWTVVGNSRGDLFEGANAANNETASGATSQLEVPELSLDGAAITAAFGEQEQTHWFLCRVPVGKDVRLRLDLPADLGVTELYAGRGFVPTPEHYTARQREFGTPDTSLVVSGALDPSPDGTNVLYVAAVGRVLDATPITFQLWAESAGFQLEAVTPTKVGSCGLVTLEIRGSGLNTNTGFTLRLGSVERSAIRLSARESGRVFATFDLTGFPIGLAAVAASQHGLEVTRAEAVEVVDGGTGVLYATLNGPNVTRAGRFTTWFVTYGNRGLVDLRLPLLRFSAPGASEIRLFDHTANWGDAFTFLGLHPDVLLPTLGPGQETTLEVRVKVPAPTRIRLQALSGERLAIDATPFRWQSLPAPPGADAAHWAAMLRTLPARLGTTVADYAALLERDLDERRASPLGYASLANINGRWLTGDEREGGPEAWPILEISPEEEAEASVAPSRLALHVPPARPPADGIRKTWFVYFAIHDYSGRRPKDHVGTEGDLVATAKDAQDIWEYLTSELRVPEEQIGGGYDAPGDDAAWSRENILSELSTFAGKVDADDNLVIIYSGHGGRGQDGKGYLVPNGKGVISPAAFAAAIDKVGAGTTYFVNQACHSEAFNESVHPTQTRLVSFASTKRDRVAWGNRASGSYAINGLKTQLRQGESLATAFERTEALVTDRFKDQPQEKSRQQPVLLNPDGVDLSSNPWTDPAGLEQELAHAFNEADFPEWDTADLDTVGSVDPNDKYALAGAGPERWVHPGQALSYQVLFENKSNAPAPAQEVLVIDDLDPRYDWSTFELRSVAFNDARLTVPSGLQRYTTTTTVGTDPNPVAVEVSFNPVTGRITWLMRSFDVATGDLPEDPYAGFLPPNNAEHHGEGSLTYSVRPRPGLPDGTQLTNRATIVFDPTYGVNPPIVTPWVTNTLDSIPPESLVSPLQPQVSGEFPVSWYGADPFNGSGIASFDVYVSRDDEPYSLWQTANAGTTATFQGQPGSTYRFYSVARDAAGNVESAPQAPDAVTTLAGGLSFANWSTTQGLPLHLAGPDDDPDQDGLLNFSEYALALNPMQPDALLAAPWPGVVQVAGQLYLTLTYRRPVTEPSDVRYRITVSRQAFPWDKATTVLPVGEPRSHGAYVEVTVRATEPLGYRPAGFLRLQIER